MQDFFGSRRLVPLILLLTLSSAGCATLRDGMQHTLAIETTGASTATCYVMRQDQSLGAVMTPGRIEISKSIKELDITCQAPGFADAVVKVPSEWAQNAKLQMPEGYVVDFATGAMWQHPVKVTVPMQRLPGAQEPARRGRRTS